MNHLEDDMLAFRGVPPQTRPETRTRAGDPETSLLAASEVDMRSQYVKILRTMVGLRPVTYHPLIPANSAGRITELHQAGLIECVGKATGKPRGRLWVITAAGREAIGA